MEWPGEIAAIFTRWIVKLTRRPTLVFFSLVQPLVWFALFTSAFSAVASIPGFKVQTGTDSYITFFTGAVLIQTIASSALQSGVGMVDDLESGFLDKMKVAPIRKSSILLGKVFSDGARIVVQSFIIIMLALLVGVNVASGAFGVLIILVLAALFGVAWSGISTFIALATKNSETTLLVSLLTTFPLLFLSTAVMPKFLLPAWVQQVASVNPFSFIAAGFQSLVIEGFVWDKIGAAFLVTLIIGLLTLSASIAMFRRTVT